MKQTDYNGLCRLILSSLLNEQKKTRQNIGDICKKYDIKTTKYYQIKAIASNDFGSKYLSGRKLAPTTLMQILGRLGYNVKHIDKYEITV